MPTPNPLAPVKGAGTTFWVYNGNGDPYSNPLSDVDWFRLAQVKDVTPGEMSAVSEDDTYLDDENADWSSKAQGQKSAGETSVTLGWKPGESGQKELVRWFSSGDVRAYKIRYPNGTVDVFKGWPSSLGKTITSKEVITRTVKITNSGKPLLAEENGVPVVAVTGVTLDQLSATVAAGATLTLNVAVQPVGASDNTFRVSTTDPGVATARASGNRITVAGVSAGEVSIVVMTSDGHFVAICNVVVS